MTTANRATNTDSLRANGFRAWMDADDANWYDALDVNGFTNTDSLRANGFLQ